MAVSALFMILMFFMPETGISFLDRAVTGMGAGIDRTIPLVLAAFCIAVMIIIEKSKHRGFTHTPAGLLVVSAPLIYMLLAKTMFAGADIAVSAQIGFVMGWFSHMIADTFNSPGIPWLGPIAKKRFRIMRITSGTGQEAAFRLISIAVFFVCYSIIIF
jgi:membrane-bound metal-dependent hydrolase YbcI (DUF457 family)